MDKIYHETSGTWVNLYKSPKMYDKDSIKEICRSMFSAWDEDKLDQYATQMAGKYSTIKQGDNVVHLEYYDGLIDKDDIHEIESILSNEGIVLSRFDKNGVAYASLEDFTLQVSIFLSDPIVQSVLLGLGTNALWDALKKITFLGWQRIKQRPWFSAGRSKPLNYGLRIERKNKSTIEIKISGDFSDEIAMQAIEQIGGLIKEEQDKPPSSYGDFFVFDEAMQMWIVVDKMAAYRDLAAKNTK